ncbi:hypothetical protein COY62_01050 [bacterium (Candidatus Howlettbacteria) CG_4_10_14_0_8_um_filter_40_9]|nr:MAG: hypothetical protein COY62_01050 [bacterium (Candidatus Howlettbacteria) CG_4_10_14_0_8_um_filter_40_9]
MFEKSVNKNNKKKRVNEMKEENKAKVLVEQYTSELKAIHEYVKELPSMKKTLEGNREAIAELKVDATMIKEDVKVLKTDVKVLKEDVKVLKDDVKVLKTDVKVQKEDVKELKADMKSVKGRLTEIERRLVSLEFDSRISKDNYKDIKGHLVSIEEELQEVKGLLKTKAEKEDVSHLEKRMILLENNLNA